MDYKISKPEEYQQMWYVFVGNKNNLECPIKIGFENILDIHESITKGYHLDVPVMISDDVSTYYLENINLNRWLSIRSGKCYYSLDKDVCERLFKQELRIKKEKIIKKIRKLSKVLNQIEKIEEENNLVPIY